MTHSTISEINVQKYSGVGKVNVEIKFTFSDMVYVIANITGNTVKFYVKSETRRSKIHQILLLLILYGITINEIIMEYTSNDLY